MKQSENLDVYQNAYSKEFKFNDENHYFLSHYAQRIAHTIQRNNYQSVLSLGIGHNVVTDIIRKELDGSLDLYRILEGSKDLVDSFSKEVNDERVEVIHTYFEDYETSEQFDVIEMGFVLEHVDDPAAILRQYKKLLKKGGTCFIGVPNARSLHRLIGFEAGLLPNLNQLSEGDLQLGHKRYFDLESISSMVRDAGYQITRVSGLLLKPVTASQMAMLGWNENIFEALLKIGEVYPEIANCILIESEL